MTFSIPGLGKLKPGNLLNYCENQIPQIPSPPGEWEMSQVENYWIRVFKG